MSSLERPEPGREDNGFAGVLSVLRRRWPIVVGVVLACVAVAVVNHKKAAKMYAATSSVSFQSSTLSDSALQVAPAGSGDPQRDADTQVFIAHSPEVAQAAATQLKIPANPSELLSQVSVEAAANADVLNIKATTADPRYSARLANAFAQQYITFKTKSQLASIDAAQSQLQKQINELPAGSAERATLEQSSQRLGALRAVAGGSATIIGLATPPLTPTGTSLSMTIVIGFTLGLAIAFLIIFALESLDRRMKTIEDFEREYRLPALTGVPQSAFRHRKAEKRDEMLEPYRILRSALDFAAVTRQLDTLLVTSAVSGEGKTTVAIDLAHAIALTGRRVVLVELDLRRPTFAEHFKLSPGNGLTAALTGGGPVAEMLVEPFADLPNFSVLPSGRLPHNPSELLGSRRITEMLSGLLTDKGIVVVDAPPLNPVADAQVLLNNSAISAAIIVARVDKTTREEVRRARAILDRHMVEPVGIVITGLRDGGRYGYEPYGEVASSLEVDIDSLTQPRSRPVQRPAQL